MPAKNQDFEIVAGDSRKIVITVDMDGDLGGATIKWWMGRTPKSTGENIFVQKQNGDGILVLAERTFEISLLPADTAETPDGRWYHEAEVTDAFDNVTTVTIGRVTVLPSLIPPPEAP
jgi:hypothetical protein